MRGDVHARPASQQRLANPFLCTQGLPCEQTCTPQGHLRPPPLPFPAGEPSTLSPSPHPTPPFVGILRLPASPPPSPCGRPAPGLPCLYCLQVVAWCSRADVHRFLCYQPEKQVGCGFAGRGLLCHHAGKKPQCTRTLTVAPPLPPTAKPFVAACATPSPPTHLPAASCHPYMCWGRSWAAPTACAALTPAPWALWGWARSWSASSTGSSTSCTHR